MNPPDDSPAAADLAATVAARVAAETNIEPATAAPELFTDTELFRWAELGGDAAGAFPFAHIAKNKVMRPAGSETVLIFRGHFWEPDRLGCHKTHLLNLVTAAVNKLASRDKPHPAILSLKKRLMTTRGQHSILEYAFSCMPNALTSDPATHNQNKNLLAFKNGVIELDTGILRPGRPEDLITRHIPHNHPGKNDSAVEWEKFLLDIFGKDIELIHFLQRFLGYVLTGTNTIHCCEAERIFMEKKHEQTFVPAPWRNYNLSASKSPTAPEPYAAQHHEYHRQSGISAVSEEPMISNKPSRMKSNFCKITVTHSET